MDYQRKLDILRLARYMYQQPQGSFLTDYDYDEMVKGTELEGVPYEDDDPKLLNMGLAEELGIDVESLPIQKQINKKKLELEALWNRNRSIRMINTEEELMEYSRDSYNLGFKELFCSVKCDGWNITCYYIPDQEGVFYAHTRGSSRSSSITECTDLMKQVVPNMKVEYPTKVVGELVLNKTRFEELRVNNPYKPLANVRNSVSSFVHGTIKGDPKYYLMYLTFHIDDHHTNFNTAMGEFSYLKNKGFNVPPCYTIDLSRTNPYLAVLKSGEFYKENFFKFVESDGLVIKPLDSSTEVENYSSYQKGAVAFKGGVWGNKVYESEIEEIYFSYGKKEVVPIARVTPTRSDIGTVITNVPLYNLRLVAEYKLDVGVRIKFSYHSNQIVKFEGVCTE